MRLARFIPQLVIGLAVYSMLVSCASCSTRAAPAYHCPPPNSPLPQNSIWHRTDAKTRQGVVLAVHGLNLQPEKMDSLARALNEDGFDVLRASLSGHRGDNAEFKKVSREIWLQDVFRLYCEARQEAETRKLPLHLLGYSLGALISLDLVNDVPEANARFERMVLLAPAISVKWTSHLIRALGIFGGGFTVPSFSNPSYRANPGGTTMAAYGALFDAMGAVQDSGFKISKESRVPTLVLIDPKDELVSESGIQDLILKNQLQQWKLVEVSTQASKLPMGAYHHLIIDENSLGAEEWARVRKLIRDHLIK